MANKWLAHVKKTMKAHKGMKFGQVLKLAKKSYGKKGGADEAVDESVSSSEEMTPAPAAGRRRRSRKTARKTRRSRK